MTAAEEPNWIRSMGQLGASPRDARRDLQWEEARRNALVLTGTAKLYALEPEVYTTLIHMGYFEDAVGHEVLDESDILFEPDELPGLLGSDVYGMDAYDTANLLYMASEALEGIRDEDELVGDLSRWLYDRVEGSMILRPVSKEVAAQFIEAHHSQFGYLNPKGLLYAIGAYWPPDRLISVATVNTPTGALGDRPDCPFDGMVELTRIASIGGLRRTDRKGRSVPVGASSALAARVLDRLEESGRRGTPGCLFVTYSLPTERGTTYLSLITKGLRPVGMTQVKKKQTGARKGATRSKPAVPKVRWEAGPAALPPEWSTIRPDYREKAQAAHNTWRKRQGLDRLAEQRELF